jgi:preprotein translocase subunit SecG
MGEARSPQRVTRALGAAAGMVRSMLFPVVAFIVIGLPLLVLAYLAVRRSKTVGEHPAPETPEEQARIEDEFAQAEAYQEEWRENERR